MRAVPRTRPAASWFVCAALLVLVGANRAIAEEGQNRLAGERSPYLRQHASNPVDWYPWGDEAFQRAKRENRPVFLSIGYAACHWCHVMEHESFEDPPTAVMLNRAFVCVKVDREERPDIDALYMRAIYALGSRGGWPATLILTPDGDPFWGGTYLSRNATRGLANRMRDRWARDRRSLVSKGKRTAAQLRSQSGTPRLPRSPATDAQVIQQFRVNLQRSFDGTHSGYRQNRKFPPHAELLFFLDRGGAFARPEDLAMMRKTLEAMDEGGIHDQVGGGFHRYTVDAIWLVPHFEKMLYDNALLIQAYALLAARTQDLRFRRAAIRALEWVERALARPGGGYGSSLDADTQGHEGTTYTWTLRQLEAALSPDEYAFALKAFGATHRGNFSEGGLFAGASGRNVLHLPRPLNHIAVRTRTGVPVVQRRLDGVTARLLTVRQRRPQPALDDKVITSWNGMLLGALARAGKHLGEARYLERARRLARFLLERSRLPDGTLLRFPVGAGRALPGYADDYVWLIDGLLLLAEATGEHEWTEAGTNLARRLIQGFEDPAGGFWSTSTRHEALFARQKGYTDAPIPSDNGMAARVLLKLYAETGDAAFQAAGARTLAAFRPLLAGGGSRSLTCLAHALALRRAQATSGSQRVRRGEVFERQDVVEVDAFLERRVVRAGGAVSVVVRVALDEGWHVNAHEPSTETLIGTTLALEQGARIELASVTYPAVVRRPVGPTRAVLALYEGTFDLRATLRVPADLPQGAHTTAILLTLQACDRSTCKEPMVVRLQLPLAVATENGPLLHPEHFR